MENCRTFQIRFNEFSEGNVITDILASNVRLRGRLFQIEMSKLRQNRQQRILLMIVGAVWRKNKIIFVRLTLPTR